MTPDSTDGRSAAPVALHRDARWVREAYERFVGSGGRRTPEGIDPVVAESWRRSLRSGVDPDGPDGDGGLADADLEDHRSRHPLAVAMPLVRDLTGAATSEGLVVAVSDEGGRLLWVEGRGAGRRTADRVGFVEGAVWREELVGTNAPGTALATRRPVQVIGAEHFWRPVQGLSCTAAPVHDPVTGGVLGVLDVTGGRVAASPVALSLVRATVASVERELAARLATLADAGRPPWLSGPGLSRGGVWRRTAGPELQVLGRPALHGRPLALRHAEIVLLLAEHPRGLSAEELAVLLHPGHLSLVAVRAEMSRLRRAVEAVPGGWAGSVTPGPLLAGSRPYRLARPLVTDAATVRHLLACGDVRGALAAYPEPVLRRSVAPGVERVRDELAAEVRAAVLATRDTGTVEAWAARDEGADDHAAWSLLARLAAPGTPRAARAKARLALLDRDLS